MKNYKEFKKQYAKNIKKFDKTTENMMVIDNSSKDIKTMLDGLKPAKLKQFWHNIMKHFQNRINYDKDENYKIVSDDLYRNGIFSDDDYEIANNLNKKVELKEDADIRKKARNKNDAR